MKFTAGIAAFGVILPTHTFGYSMNETEIDTMVKDSCNGDAMCIQLMQELDTLELQRSTGDRTQFLRRLKQLKSLILHLQPEHRFARYCFYGCWCLPDAGHKISSPGYGRPVDAIDSSCKRQAQCYECAMMDHAGYDCSPDTQSYKYRLHRDDSDPRNHWKNTVECINEPINRKTGQVDTKHSCLRSLCECDKKLAEDLRENFDFCTANHHQTQGTFNAPEECTRGCEQAGGCGDGQAGPPSCCGDYPDRFPFKTMNGRRACCGDRTYDNTVQECCSDGHLSAIGGC